MQQSAAMLNGFRDVNQNCTNARIQGVEEGVVGGGAQLLFVGWTGSGGPEVVDRKWWTGSGPQHDGKGRGRPLAWHRPVLLRLRVLS